MKKYAHFMWAGAGLVLVFGWIFGWPTFSGLLGVVFLTIFFTSPPRRSYDGYMILLEDGGGVRKYSLEVSKDPELFLEQDEIVFKVVKTPVPEPPR